MRWMERQREQDKVSDLESERRVRFDLLVHLHAREIRHFLEKLCGNHHDAEELAQDVFVKAYRAMDGLRDPGAARRWLYRIAARHFHDWLRPTGRRRARSTAPLPLDGPRARAEDRPGPRLMADELEERIHAWTRELPERQRTVLLMHATAGFDYAEIARVLGISPEAVKVNLFHAREKLRRKVERFMES